MPSPSRARGPLQRHLLPRTQLTTPSIPCRIPTIAIFAPSSWDVVDVEVPTSFVLLFGLACTHRQVSTQHIESGRAREAQRAPATFRVSCPLGILVVLLYAARVFGGCCAVTVWIESAPATMSLCRTRPRKAPHPFRSATPSPFLEFLSTLHLAVRCITLRRHVLETTRVSLVVVCIPCVFDVVDASSFTRPCPPSTV